MFSIAVMAKLIFDFSVRNSIEFRFIKNLLNYITIKIKRQFLPLQLKVGI